MTKNEEGDSTVTLTDHNAEEIPSLSQPIILFVEFITFVKCYKFALNTKHYHPFYLKEKRGLFKLT